MTIKEPKPNGFWDRAKRVANAIGEIDQATGAQHLGDDFDQLKAIADRIIERMRGKEQSEDRVQQAIDEA